jgi:hypothetical protein
MNSSFETGLERWLLGDDDWSNSINEDVLSDEYKGALW